VANKPRRELKRIELAARGLALTLVIALALGLVWLKNSGAFGGDPELAADVPTAGGSLAKGSDVKILGVIVGKVTTITRADDGGVRVGMKIAGSELDRIPANVQARILPATVFGTSFLDLVVKGTPSKDPLKAGAKIPADLSVDTLELQQALDDIDRLVRALGPAELQQAIASAAEALKGRGQKIGDIMELADRYLARLHPQIPLIRTDLEKLAANLDLVDELAPDFLDATEDALVTFNTIVSQRATIAQLITGATALTQDSRELLKATVPDAVRFLDNGVILLDALYDNRKVGITDAIKTNLMLGESVAKIREKNWIQSDAITTFGAPEFYKVKDRPQWGKGSARTSARVPSLRSLVKGAN